MRNLTFLETAERSIIRKYRRELWNPFIAAVKRYALIREGDRIAVCISGGKDSFLLAKLIQELIRHSEVPFEAEYLVMDPGYTPEIRRKVEQNAVLLNIPATFFNTEIFKEISGKHRSPCYPCARARRGHLYSLARSLGCNKIALGHHLNDAVETTLMGLLWGAQFQTMMPKLRSKNFPGMELIRPLYCVREDHIVAWARYNRMEFIRCACPLSEKGADTSKRRETKELIAMLKRTNPDVENRIFKSTHMVNLETVIGFKHGGKEHSFLDE